MAWTLWPKYVSFLDGRSSNVVPKAAEGMAVAGLPNLRTARGEPSAMENLPEGTAKAEGSFCLSSSVVWSKARLVRLKRLLLQKLGKKVLVVPLYEGMPCVLGINAGQLPT